MTITSPLPSHIGELLGTTNAANVERQDCDAEAARPRANALNTCSKATACAGHLAMLFFGTVLQKHITAKALGADPDGACQTQHPGLAEQVPTGVLLATGALAALLALPSVAGLIKSFTKRDSA